MQVGRDLDFLISENVMGECAHRKHEKYVYQDDWSYLCVVCGSEEECPHYSTDISAAWKVVEKLEHLHPNLSYCDTTCTWTVFFWKTGERKSVTADTAPLAICLAALRATENTHNPL